MMRIWISGAGGMMGSHLAEMAMQAGHDVLATFYKPTIDLIDMQALPLQEVDVRDWCSVYDSLEQFQPDAVFHLAAQSYPTVSWQRPTETLETNVVGTANIFEAMRRLGSKARVIVAGSSAEYGAVDPDKVPISEDTPLLPLHPYGVSKVATDLLAFQYHASFGTDTVRVRIFNCTGPRKVGDALSDFARRVAWLERHPEECHIRVGNLATRRTIVDVQDLNRGLMLLLEKGDSGDVYNLGGSTAYLMEDLLSCVIRKSIRTDIVPLVDPVLLRPTDEQIIWGDSTKLNAVTGWKQTRPLDKTVQDMLDYWRQKPKAALLA
jgi:GDP-4-dehydro-6-deoxy-D-mannose reductase